MKKKVAALLALLMVFPSFAFASSGSDVGGGTFTVENLNSIIGAVTSDISITTIIPMLVAMVGASIGLVFMWWGIRRLVRTFMSAFRKGRVSV